MTDTNTNICLHSHRGFGISSTLSWGLNSAVTRELTDTMYDPSLSPYVTHEEGIIIIIIIGHTTCLFFAPPSHSKEFHTMCVALCNFVNPYGPFKALG